MKFLGVIPSRYASSRFPGKSLAVIGEKTMIQRVYEQASKAKFLDAVVVATDDNAIANHVKSFGGQVIMTSEKHPSGTDRVNEAVGIYGNDFQVIVNIQGDEPLIDPTVIDETVLALYSFIIRSPSIVSDILSTLLFSPSSSSIISFFDMPERFEYNLVSNLSVDVSNVYTTTLFPCIYRFNAILIRKPVLCE